MLTGTIHFEVLTAGTPNLAERRNLWGDNPIRLRPAGPAEDPESKLIGAVELPGPVKTLMQTAAKVMTTVAHRV